jgi:DNA-binding MarR family transcriptional regulator
MPASPAAREAWGLFWRIFSEDKARRMGIFGRLGIAPMQAQALISLTPGEPMAMSALAERMQCDNSNVTGIADRLEAAGAVERRPAAHDRRVKTLVLTPAGEQLRLEVQRRMSEPPPAIAALSEEDARALREILARAVADIDGPRV